MAQGSDTVAIEALQRLKGADLEANPALKTAVNKVLDRIRDQSAFVELVRDFKLKERSPEVLSFVRTHPEDALALDGLRFVQASQPGLISSALASEPGSAVWLGLLGRLGGPDALALLRGMVLEDKHPLESRQAAVRGLAYSQPGAQSLLELAEAKQVPEALLPLAQAELQAVRWDEIKIRAGKLNPVSKDRLPPKAQLLQLAGDAARGAKVFQKAEVGCATCHQVNGVGVDFGPRLSEIGAKLSKEALYDAILEPSAGISFGFEAWLFVLKDGDETLGLLASETDEFVLLKLPGGQSVRLAKREIARREKQPQSIMPAGLVEPLKAQEVADLLEYLVGLKKATP
jgi:putative heme-binding domain-containing protein